MPHPDKRSALHVLTVKRLASLCSAFELDRAGASRKDDLVELLAPSKRASFEAILGMLKREELKDICRAHDLDDSGKEKEPIIARILGREVEGQPRLPGVGAGSSRQTGDDEAEAEAPEATPKRGRRRRVESFSEAGDGASAEPAQRRAKSKDKKSKGGDLDFQQTLWQAADKLRNNMDAAEYKHVVLGLIFLKYISDAFAERYRQLEIQLADPKSDLYTDDPEVRAETLEDRDEYSAENVFWVPKESRWEAIQAKAKTPKIGEAIDRAMDLLERENPPLKGTLTKNYARPALDKHRLGELIDLIGKIGLGDAASRSKDILGRVYEYFLSNFASAEGKKGGQFYTPRHVVQILVEMLSPYRGRVFDPCCGSGGMFVQSARFVDEHTGKRTDISIYGQESNPTTWRLARMNLAIRGIRGNLGDEPADSFHKDLHKDLKADYILANPPFNDSDWRGDQLGDDVRWKYGKPPPGNANFAWVQHFIHHLAPRGFAGFVLANGSMSSNQSGEGEIRKSIVEADLVDCMVALPGQLFFSTGIPVCLWFLARNKKDGTLRDRRGEVLFIDARKLGSMIDRTHRELTEGDVARIAGVYHAWRGDKGAGAGVYEDVAGFCRATRVEEIAEHGFVLTPGRYVGAEEVEEGEEPFGVVMKRLVKALREQQAEAGRLDAVISGSLKELGYGG